MADVAAQTSWQDEYRRLRLARVPRSEALKRSGAPAAVIQRHGGGVDAPAPVAAPDVSVDGGAGGAAVAPSASKTESAVRGAVQGATAGLADELGGIAAVDPYAFNPLAGEMYMRHDAPSSLDEMRGRYREARDAERSQNDAARNANPKTYLAGQIGGGVATTAAVGAPTTALRAARAGAAYGAASGAGESEADLTNGEVAQFAADVAKGGAIGGILGPVGHAVGKGVGAVANRLRGTSRAAEKAATEVADNADLPSMIGKGETIRTATEKAQALQKEWSGMLGEQYRLRPSQATGDPALALAESRAAQFPKTMLRAQAEEAKRLEQSAKIVDMYVDGIAIDPSRLGRADVGRELIGAVDRHLDGLVAARSTVAAPLYEAAEAAGTDVSARPILDSIRGMIDQNKFNPSNVTAQLKGLLGKVDEAAKDGGLSIRDTQNLRSLMTKAVRGKATIIDNMEIENQMRIAREVLTSIDAALDESAELAGGHGARLLKQANAAWRAGSKEIDEATTDTVARILKVGATDSADTLTSRLASASPEQVSGVFGLLNKTAPETAQQFRAQLLDDVLVRGGKPSRAAPMAAEMGVSKLSPRQSISALQKAEPMLQAAFSGDTKAKLALSRMYQLLQRLDFGPNIRGSQTAPLLAQAAEEAGDIAAAASGPQGMAVWRGIKSFMTSDKAKAEALTTAKGIDDFNRILEGALDLSQGRKLSAELGRALSVSLTRYVVDEATDQPDRPKPPTRNMDIRR